MKFMYTIEHLHHLYCSVITYFGRILAMKTYERLRGVLLLIWVKESKKQGANTDKQEAIPCKFQLSHLGLLPATAHAYWKDAAYLQLQGASQSRNDRRKLCLKIRPTFSYVSNEICVPSLASVPACDTWHAPDFQPMDGRLSFLSTENGKLR